MDAVDRNWIYFAGFEVDTASSKFWNKGTNDVSVIYNRGSFRTKSQINDRVCTD